MDTELIDLSWSTASSSNSLLTLSSTSKASFIYSFFFDIDGLLSPTSYYRSSCIFSMLFSLSKACCWSCILIVPFVLDVVAPVLNLENCFLNFIAVLLVPILPLSLILPMFRLALLFPLDCCCLLFYLYCPLDSPRCRCCDWPAAPPISIFYASFPFVLII